MSSLKFLIISWIILFCSYTKAEINISHAIAMHGSPKYEKNFLHVNYANPKAIKGGSIVRSAIGTFDTFNPFTLKGTPAAGIGNLFETLTTSSSDEAFTEYGLLAETIEWPDDRSWVAFTLRQEAKWHDGKKITAEDVVWTFNTLMEKGHPFYGYYYADVTEALKVSELKVKFIKTLRKTIQYWKPSGGHPPTNIAIGGGVSAADARFAISLAIRLNDKVDGLIHQRLNPANYVAIATSAWDDKSETKISQESLKKLRAPSLNSEEFHKLYRKLTGEAKVGRTFY